ncbi:hypothetical protein SCAZ3_00995 [Streptococcus canis FSL Z3-227]|uniref:Uncharacterized protein n=1 Tax=Streptococcus canis FSL Z3-227 TaxID=482234 RepID=A0AAV3FRF4_STRCB|nr:hypothetical protein SCAZ3_00995 [Streptococcus canis FSL Z3-227]
MIKQRLVSKNSRALIVRKDSPLAKSKDNGVIRGTFYFLEIIKSMGCLI